MRRAFLAPGLLLILVAIGGRYTLDRAGLVDLAWVDLRVIGLLVALAVLILNGAHVRGAPPGREGWLIAALLFFLFQIASALWAPPAARVGPQVLDLVLLGVLLVASHQYTIGDPETVIRFTFQLFFVAAVVYALAAIFISGPGEQGRYSAFGGGPNVFARIEVLGVISAIALFMLTGRKLPLLFIPLFLLATVLSGSRGTLVAGAVVGFAALLKLRHRLSAAGVAAAGVVSLVAVGLIAALAPPEFTDLFQERFVEQTVQEQYLSGRTDIWMAAVRLFADHPIGGAGLDGFYGLIGVNQAVEYPHNYVLAVAAEGGLAGLGLLTVSVLLWTRVVRGGGHRPQLTGLAVASAVFVALSGLFSGDYYDSRLAWIFAAMAAAAALVPTFSESKPLAVVAR
ncbi:O-antigen ligase family protein [Actinoplanes sp. NPDC049802]|uniref:O-antigen ligase family protein n=1 Tax=Actinoplanes sp. NPDC049802 TaxID=3154742 RepID=UPI0033EE1E46